MEICFLVPLVANEPVGYESLSVSGLLLVKTNKNQWLLGVNHWEIIDYFVNVAKF